MINQEDLYQSILKEEWGVILGVLYTHRKKILYDLMLKQATTTFENEFFGKVKEYAVNRKDITDNLETLYILNHGNFYNLSSDNFKTLIVELVKRKPLIEAVNFAKYFPDEEICKKTINDYAQHKLDTTFNTTNKLPMNWIEIYNRLFELINDQTNTATYYSGPRFINTIKEFDKYYPDYGQYIAQRNTNGKSTSRKIYYYDILIELKEDIRLKVINRILEVVKPFEREKTKKIEFLLTGKNDGNEIASKDTSAVTSTSKPVVFISYSWDSEDHKLWVLNLANRLCSNGIEVILDRYHLKPGKNLPHFVESSIKLANRIIIIFTPNYKLKADKRSGGVGYEYSIMNSDLYNNQTDNEKIIPLLRNGTKEDSIPAFMQQYIHLDMTNDEKFENSYTDLIREIYDEPAIVRPTIGEKPKF